MSKCVANKSLRVPVCVIGQDIDRELVTNLSPREGQFAGDRVMVEINGKRQYSCQPHPLTAEMAWEVVRNDSEALTLAHPHCQKELVLRWGDLLKGPPGEPAVFLTRDPYLSKSDLFIVLQFVAYTAYSDEVVKALPPEWDMEIWDEILPDPLVKRATLDKITEDLRKLAKGWGWRSTCRFALRSGVPKGTIESIQRGDWFKIANMSDQLILSILQELRWMRAYRMQSEQVQISPVDHDKSAGESAKA